MSSWRGLSLPERRLSSAVKPILGSPRGRSDVILEDDAAIVIQDDVAPRARD
jgi:hypothetical protein